MDNIKKILEDVFGKISVGGSTSVSGINQVWVKNLSRNEQAHTRLEGINQGNLLVLVDTPAWLHHMKTRHDYLLSKLKESIPEIQQISFKLGKIK